MKILLAGMNYMPNQFSRNIELAGCQVVHTSGDPGAFPKWCEAVVVAKCQISHQKFYDVKDEYVKQGKPVFIGDNFSTFKERFLNFVEKRRANKMQETTMGQAFASAKIIEPPKPVLVKEDTVRENAEYNFAVRYDPKVKAEILKVVGESHRAGMSAKDTMELLKLHNLKKANGGDFELADVYSFRKHAGAIHKAEVKLEAKREKRAAKIAQSPPPQHSSPKNSGSNELQLFNRILDLNLDPTKTVQFQNWLRAGQINIEQAIWFLEIIEAKK